MVVTVVMSKECFPVAVAVHAQRLESVFGKVKVAGLLEVDALVVHSL